MKKITRYISVIDEEDVLNKPVWCLNKKPTDTPYIKIEVKIIEKEKLYSHKRKAKKKKSIFRRSI